MIAAIDFREVDDRASVTPLVNGVVFRLPFSFGTGSMMLASLGGHSIPPRGLRDIGLAEFQRQASFYEFVGYRVATIRSTTLRCPIASGFAFPNLS